MKQNKWKSNEANDKSATGAEASVERRNGETESLLKKKLNPSSVVNIYWPIMSPSLHIHGVSDVDIKKYSKVRLAFTFRISSLQSPPTLYDL